MVRYDQGYVRKKKIPTFVIILGVLLIVYLIVYFTGIGHQDNMEYKASMEPCVGSWVLDEKTTSKKLKEAESVTEVFGSSFSASDARITVGAEGNVIFEPGDGSSDAGQVSETDIGVSGWLENDLGEQEEILLWSRDDVLIFHIHGENTYWSRE